MVINGRPHGPQRATTACQLHMRHFTDGQEVWIEPWRARAFPVVKDLVVDRSAFDRIIQAGGFITVRAGRDRKSTRLNSSHGSISYAVFCLKKKNKRGTSRICA